MQATVRTTVWLIFEPIVYVGAAMTSMQTVNNSVFSIRRGLGPTTQRQRQQSKIGKTERGRCRFWCGHAHGDVRSEMFIALTFLWCLIDWKHVLPYRHFPAACVRHNWARLEIPCIFDDTSHRIAVNWKICVHSNCVFCTVGSPVCIAYA